MFEKHIEQLQGLLTVGPTSRDADDREALDAAIVLMRAAEPKDEAGERTYCTRAANRLFEPGSDVCADVYKELIRERAAARAEVIAELGKPKDEAAERKHCAEIAFEFRDDTNTTFDLNTLLRAAITAARAEGFKQGFEACCGREPGDASTK